MESPFPPEGGVMLTDEPVPLREIACGEPEALSVNVRVPVRAPLAVGVKVTETVHFAPAATLVPQVLVSAKSPEAAMEVIASAAVPELVKVTVCPALVEPTVCEAKLRLAGETLAAGDGDATVMEIGEAFEGAKLLSPA